MSTPSLNLPPLKREQMDSQHTPPSGSGLKRLIPGGWMQRQSSRFDAFLTSAVNDKTPWAKRIGFWAIRKAWSAVSYFGRQFPYAYRMLWLAPLCRHVNKQLDKRSPLEQASVGTRFLRRLFSVKNPKDGKFRPHYLALNLPIVYVIATLAGNVGLTGLNGLYAWSTHGYYNDVVVTQTEILPQQKDHGYGIHGYLCRANAEGQCQTAAQAIKNGDDLYMELEQSDWYLKFAPEQTFSNIAVYGRCNFETYGMMLRFPKIVRFLTPDILLLSPHIINATCTLPQGLLPGQAPPVAGAQSPVTNTAQNPAPQPPIYGTPMTATISHDVAAALHL